ncbi:hypothetical protein HK104_005189 [Borealophlyctis nickersoniae]|nr:hypothetical protein HK104_005189 [Borealophlyctis nickersoniae]
MPPKRKEANQLTKDDFEAGKAEESSKKIRSWVKPDDTPSREVKTVSGKLDAPTPETPSRPNPFFSTFSFGTPASASPSPSNPPATSRVAPPPAFGAPASTPSQSAFGTGSASNPYSKPPMPFFEQKNSPLAAFKTVPSVMETPKPTFAAFGSTPSTTSENNNSLFAAPTPTSGFDPSKFKFGAAKPAGVPNFTTAGTASEQNKEALLEYVIELRGLNKSFAAFVQSKVDADPFVDLTPAVGEYESYHKKISTGKDSVRKALQKVKEELSAAKSATKSALESATTVAESVPKSVAAGKSAPKSASPSFSSSTRTAGESAPNSGFAFLSSGESAPKSAFPSFSTNAGTAGESAPKSAFPSFSTNAGTAGESAPKSAFAFSSSAESTPNSTVSSFSTTFQFAKPNPAVNSFFGAPAPALVQAGSSHLTEEEEEDAASPEEQIGDALMKGQGEEEEETIFEQRSKLYRWVEERMEGTDRKPANWEPVGLGPMRLNKNHETGKARLLLRADTSGRVILNTFLYSGMTPNVNKNELRFLIVEGQKGVQFLAKFKQESDAVKLKEEIEKHRG